MKTLAEVLKPHAVAFDWVGIEAHIVDQEPVGAVLSDPLEGFFGGRLVDVIVDGDLRPRFGEPECDSTSDAPRPSRDQCVLALK